MYIVIQCQSKQTTSLIIDIALVWIWNVPKGPCIKDLVPSMPLPGGGGRRISHWGIPWKKMVGSWSLSLCLYREMSTFVLPHDPTRMCCLPTGSQPTMDWNLWKYEPRHTCLFMFFQYPLQ
jgi:hypothetical protein